MAPKGHSGTCDAHDLLVSNINDIKQSQKDMANKINTINDYIMEKKGENNVTSIIAQKQNSKEVESVKNKIQVGFLIVAIASIIISLYSLFRR